MKSFGINNLSYSFLFGVGPLLYLGAVSAGSKFQTIIGLNSHL